MEQNNHPLGGPANTPPFESGRSALETAADHQIPEETSPAHGASGTPAGPASETERELDRTRDMLAAAAAPVMAEKTQEAIRETADRVAHDPQMREQVKRTAQAMQHDAGRLVRDKAGELADRAESRVNAGMKQAADRLDRAAEQIDQVAAQRLAGSGVKGQAGQMAHSLADGLESTASYLRTNDVQGLRSDLERQMHERPLQTLLIGVAAGWVVGKILR